MYLMILLAGTLLVSCGSSEDGDGALLSEQKNSNDPDDLSDGSDEHCLTDCNPPKEVVVSFAKPVSLAPPGCTASDLYVFDSGNGLVSFVQANCSGNSGLYASRISYTGERQSVPISIGDVCSSGTGGVARFSAAKGDSGYLLSVTCQVGQQSYSTYAVATDANGDHLSSRIVVAALSNADPVLVAWNAEAAVFGIARRGVFQRFDEDAAPLGGSVAVPASGSLTGLESYQGAWNVLQGASTIGMYENSYCSKMSTVGTLQCDRLDLKKYATTVQRVVEGKWLLDAGSYGELQVSDFTPVTCGRGEFYSYGKVVEGRIEKLFDAAIVHQNYIAALYSGAGPALNMAFLDLRSRKIVSTSAILDVNPFRNARVLITQGRIYVMVAHGNDAVMTWSEQRVDR